MELFFLWWNNGLEYSDRETTLMGVYSTEELRAKAAAEWKKDRWPFNDEGHWETAVGKLDEPCFE